MVRSLALLPKSCQGPVPPCQRAADHRSPAPQVLSVCAALDAPGAAFATGASRSDGGRAGVVGAQTERLVTCS